jgi:hypothetical protein
LRVKIGVGCSAEARGRKLFWRATSGKSIDRTVLPRSGCCGDDLRHRHRPKCRGRYASPAALPAVRDQACPSASSTARRCRAPLYRRICKSPQGRRARDLPLDRDTASGHALPASMRSTYHEVRTNTPLHNGVFEGNRAWLVARMRGCLRSVIVGVGWWGCGSRRRFGPRA